MKSKSADRTGIDGDTCSGSEFDSVVYESVVPLVEICSPVRAL